VSGEKVNVYQNTRTKMIKNCGICGRSFEAEGSRKYCSTECRRIAYDRLKKEWNRKTSNIQNKQMKENGRRKMEKGKPRKKGDGNKSLIAKNTEARAQGMSYGKYTAKEAAAAVKVDINIGGNGDVRNRKES